MNRNIDGLGRVVIPKEIRNKLGIKENDNLKIELNNNKIILSKNDEIDYKAIVKKMKKKLNEYKIKPYKEYDSDDIISDFDYILKEDKD